MKIDAPLFGREPLSPPTELNTDPLHGATGYRVQTHLQAGDCSGGNSDGCAPYTWYTHDGKGNYSCSSCNTGTL